MSFGSPTTQGDSLNGFFVSLCETWAPGRWPRLRWTTMSFKHRSTARTDTGSFRLRGGLLGPARLATRNEWNTLSTIRECLMNATALRLSRYCPIFHDRRPRLWPLILTPDLRLRPLTLTFGSGPYPDP